MSAAFALGLAVALLAPPQSPPRFEDRFTPKLQQDVARKTWTDCLFMEIDRSYRTRRSERQIIDHAFERCAWRREEYRNASKVRADDLGFEDARAFADRQTNSQEEFWRSRLPTVIQELRAEAAFHDD